MMLYGGPILDFHQLICGTFPDQTGMEATPKKIFQKRKQNMEIYYKVPIWDRLYKAIYDADIENKIIDYIVVNDEEWNQLNRWVKDTYPRINDNFYVNEDFIKFYGVKIYKYKVVNITIRVEEQNK